MSWKEKKLQAQAKREERKNNPRKTKGNYIFPDFISKAMSMVSQRTQYESALMSMSVILLSLLFTGIYTIFFTGFSTAIKVIAGVNTVAAFAFLSSMLITQYQAYKNYLQVMGLLKDINEADKKEYSNPYEEYKPKSDEEILMTNTVPNPTTTSMEEATSMEEPTSMEEAVKQAELKDPNLKSINSDLTQLKGGKNVDGRI